MTDTLIVKNCAQGRIQDFQKGGGHQQAPKV